MFRVLKKYCVTTSILTPSIFCMENNENNVQCSSVFKIRSKFILNKVFANLETKKKLEICRYNKTMQKKVNINFENYSDFNRTIIDITVKNDSNNKKPVSLFNIIKKKIIYYKLTTKEDGYENNFNLYLNNNKINFTREETELKIRESDISCSTYYSHYKVLICKRKIPIGESKFQLKIDRNADDLTALFTNCNLIKEIKVIKSWKKLKNLRCMFYGCENLENLDLHKLKTADVNDFSDMFCRCKKIKYLDISNFDTGNATTFRRMFGSCNSLEILSLNNVLIGEYCPSINLMLSYCNSLKYIIIDDDDMRESFKKRIIDLKSNSTQGLKKNQIELIKSIDCVKKDKIKLIENIDCLLNKNKKSI